ncbi:MAG TPA: universal stress protein [Nitrospira sp.]|nr:universal stress protein [Nitrospira sp.]
MPTVESSAVPVLQTVCHPTDFSPASHTAFAHALTAALIAEAKLTILHVSPHGGEEWTDFPRVRETLERWGLLPKNSERSAVAKLGIQVEKVQTVHTDPVESITAYLDNHNADLIVLATDQGKGSIQWLNRSVATGVARKSRQMTLFIPNGVDGFVSLKDGSISLKHILIPVASDPPPQPAVQAAVRMASRLRCPSGLFTLLHVGEQGAMPDVRCPDLAGWRWDKVTRSGGVVDVIDQAARETRADLIVLCTEGRNGFLDALRGSHSERVLRQSPCPVLAVPAGGFIGSVL